MSGVLRMVGGVRRYQHGDETVCALSGVDFSVATGQCVAVVGPSGSGKSTFLLVLAGWEGLTEGAVDFHSDSQVRPPASLSWNELTVVPQLLGLVPQLTVTETIMLPVKLSGGSNDVSAVFDWMQVLDVKEIIMANSKSGGQGRQTTSNSPRKGGPVRRIVEPNKNGDGYRVVAPHAQKASALEPTQKAAGARAKEIVVNLGGGEVTYKNAKGRITDSDTVGKGNDPNPPKDKKH